MKSSSSYPIHRFSTNEERSLTSRNRNSELNPSLFSASFVVLSAAIVTIAIIVNGFLPEPLNSKDVPARSQKYVALLYMESVKYQC